MSFRNPRPAVLSTRVVWFMALAARWALPASIPFNRRSRTWRASLHASLATIGVALACGPLGYLAGLALLVPLVDRFAPRPCALTSLGWMSGIPGGYAAVGVLPVLAACLPYGRTYRGSTSV
jgi:hypothetical protein